MVSVERAREVLSYDPATGALRYRVHGSGGRSPDKTYKTIRIDGHSMRAHHWAWLIHYGEMPKGNLLRVNGVDGDNRIANLFVECPGVPLTAERVRTLFDYNPETGVLTRKLPTRKTKVGEAIACGHRGVVAIDGHHYRAYRLIWLHVYGRWPERQIDHINNDPSDNRLCNLREATGTQNNGNQSMSRRNTTGVKGVYRADQPGRFYAQVTLDGKTRNLGTYGNIEDAARAYERGARAAFGEYAKACRS